jgi:hypothetical protein
MRVFGALAILLALVTVGWFVVVLLDFATVRTYRTTSSYPVVSTLELRTGDSDVHVVPDSPNRIVVDVDTRHGLQRQNFHAGVQGDTLVLTGGCQQFFGFLCHTTVTVHAPARLAINGDIRDGNVSTSGVRGAIDLAAGDGDLTFRDANGPVRIRNGDGDIDLSDLSTDALSVRMGDGDLEASLATSPGSIGVQAGDGDVNVCLPRSTPPYAVTVHHGDGSLTNQIPSDPRVSRTLVVDAGDGDITLRLC